MVKLSLSWGRAMKLIFTDKFGRAYIEKDVASFTKRFDHKRREYVSVIRKDGTEKRYHKEAFVHLRIE